MNVWTNCIYLTSTEDLRVIGRCDFGRLGRVTCFFSLEEFVLLGLEIKSLHLSRPLFPTKKSTSVLHLYIFILHLYDVKTHFQWKYFTQNIQLPHNCIYNECTKYPLCIVTYSQILVENGISCFIFHLIPLDSLKILQSMETSLLWRKLFWPFLRSHTVWHVCNSAKKNPAGPFQNVNPTQLTCVVHMLWFHQKAEMTGHKLLIYLSNEITVASEFQNYILIWDNTLP